MTLHWEASLSKKMDYEGSYNPQAMYMAYNGGDQITLITAAAILGGDTTADDAAIAAAVASFKVN